MQKFQRVFVLEDEALSQQISLAFMDDINSGNPIVFLNNPEDALHYLTATQDALEELHPVDLVIFDADVSPYSLHKFLDGIEEFQKKSDQPTGIVMLSSDVSVLPGRVHTITALNVYQKPVTEQHVMEFKAFIHSR